MEHILRILSVSTVTHDVHCVRLEKPEGFHFIPGQAADVSINKDDWREEKRPFTFTCLNDDPYLEFTIKSYNDHDGVTRQIGQIEAGAELILSDPWGAIEYKGPGYFIAGGAGITPFIAILRQLHKDGKMEGNTLFFSNKTPDDIIYEEELKTIMGEQAVFIVTQKDNDVYLHDFIDDVFLDKHIADFGCQFYICGPDPMIKSISDIVVARGADPNAVVFEK